MKGVLRRMMDLGRLVLMGRVGPVWRAFWHRLYSNHTSIGFRRDLTVLFAAPLAFQPLDVRALERGDDLSCLEAETPGLTDVQVFERLTQRRIVESGLRTCYIAVGSDGMPCYMQWLILASSNELVRTTFGNLYPRLESDEALLEGAYTPEAYRGKGIMASAMARIAERAADSGVRWVITFVDESYAPAQKGCARAGFRPYVRRVETYRLFRRYVAFLPLRQLGAIPQGQRAIDSAS